MIRINQPSRIFLAGPFTGLAGKNKELPPNVIRFIGLALKMLRKQGHFVFSSHELEQWGKATSSLTPGQLLKRDFGALKITDYLVLFPGFSGQRSPGTLMEFGYASAQMIERGKIKGLIFVRQKGDNFADLRPDYLDFLQKQLGSRFDLVEFEKPSEILLKLRRRVPVISKPRKGIGKARMHVQRILNLPRGATYFTRKQRPRPI